MNWKHLNDKSYTEGYITRILCYHAFGADKNPMRFGTVDDNSDVHSLDNPNTIIGHIEENEPT